MVSAMAAAARSVPKGKTSEASLAQACVLGWRLGVPPTSKTDVESESGVNMWVSVGAIAIARMKRIAAELVAFHALVA